MKKHLHSGGGAGRLNWSFCSFWCSFDGTRWILSWESYGPFFGQSFQLAERPRIIARSWFILFSLLLSSVPLIGCWSCDVNPESCDVVESLYSVCSFAILFKTPFFKLISSPSFTLPEYKNYQNSAIRSNLQGQVDIYNLISLIILS